MPNRPLVSGDLQPEEAQYEAGLRPRRLAEFTGQNKLKENLSIAIEAAVKRGEAMDHVLLYGPPGLGKTTLATIIAEELKVQITTTSGPVLQKKLDLTGILSNIRLHQVFFIDEVHRLLPDVEEMLYSALEDFLHVGQQTVDFVDEENLVQPDVAEDAGQVQLLLQHRPAGGCDLHLQLFRDDGRERGFPQPRRPIEQHVVHGLAAQLRRFDGNRQILFQLILSGEFDQAPRAEPRFVLRLFGLQIPGNQRPVRHVLLA